MIAFQWKADKLKPDAKKNKMWALCNIATIGPLEEVRILCYTQDF